MVHRIRLRRDSYGDWSTSNPTLGLGEAGYDTTRKIIKVGDGTTAWNTLALWRPPLRMGDLEGCALSNAADTSHDITVAVGKRRNSTDVSDIVLASALTKQIDANWAAGTNAGGLDTGAVGNSTPYYIYLISGADGVTLVDVLISASATAPTMPANYTLFRMIGALMTDGSANILPGTWSEGNQRFRYKASILDLNDSATTSIARSERTLSVPPNSKAYFSFLSYLNSTNSVQYTIITELTETDTAPSIDYFDIVSSREPSVQIYPAAGNFERKTDSARKIGTRAETTNGLETIITRGYWLDLGAYEYTA